MEDIALFDTVLLNELGDKKGILIVLGYFLDNFQHDLEELQLFLYEKQLSGVLQKSHKLKGSLSMLKATQMVAILEKLEFEAGSTKDFEKIQSLTNIFVEMFGLLEAQLIIEMDQIKASME